MQPPIKQQTIQNLRELIGATHGVVQRVCREFSQLPGLGLPQGCVVEVCGPGKTEFVAAFLREHPDLQVAWLENAITINPYALWQRGVCVNKIFFIEAGADLLWCAGQILKSSLVRVVVISDQQFHEKELRKLQLLVEKAQSHLLLLTPQMGQSWVPSLQIQMQDDRPFIHRRRGL